MFNKQVNVLIIFDKVFTFNNCCLMCYNGFSLATFISKIICDHFQLGLTPLPNRVALGTYCH